jgi:hypothetical protein
MMFMNVTIQARTCECVGKLVNAKTPGNKIVECFVKKYIITCALGAWNVRDK